MQRRYHRKILKDKNDTSHYFYIKEFLQNHLLNEPNLQNIKDINTLFYEFQKLEHIISAENTSNIRHKSGLFYIPKSITEKQTVSLCNFQKALQIRRLKHYNII